MDVSCRYCKAYLSVSSWKTRCINDTCFFFQSTFPRQQQIWILWVTDKKPSRPCWNMLGSKGPLRWTVTAPRKDKTTSWRYCLQQRNTNENWLDCSMEIPFLNILKLSCQFLWSTHASVSVLPTFNQIWIFTGVWYPERSGSFIRCCVTWCAVC